jgi:hypothetical protein
VRAFAVYLTLSIFYFGVPIASHPGRDLIGNGPDPELIVWSLAWWPHAILHGENPFVTHAVWSGVGVNLAWTVSVPGLALLASPITLLAGPVFAYNLLALLLPALAAWTAFLLCRHITHSFWPSLLGGYLFGFSPFLLGQSEGHMHMTSVCLVPLVALAVVRFVEGTLTAWRLMVMLGILLALQLSFSTEMALMVTTAVGVGWLLALALVPTARPGLRRLPVPVVGAYAIAAVLASPLLINALLHFSHQPIVQPGDAPANLLNIVLPTRLAWLSWHWTRTLSDTFARNTFETDAYLGLPMLAIIAWFAVTMRRRPAARLLLVMLGVGIIAELGTTLHIGGERYGWLPWRLVTHVPVFDNLLPFRFSMLVALGAAVATAWWAATPGPPRAARIALPLAAVATIVPSLWLGVWREHPERPSFFTAGTYRACLQPNETVLMLPAPRYDDAMLWQAEADFRFRMANGYISPALPANLPDRTYIRDHLENNIANSDWHPLIQWAREEGVTMILVDKREAGHWPGVLAPVTRPNLLGGVYLFSLRPKGRSACTQGSNSA